MSVKDESENTGMEYLVMHIPTKTVTKRRLPDMSYLSNAAQENSLNAKLAEWNRLAPGVWQYYTA